MNLGEAKAYVRRRLDDVTAPYLWLDPEIIGYINESQKEAAERAFLIYDETSTLTELDVTAGEPKVALDARIISVDRVSLDDCGSLCRTNTAELDKLSSRWERAEGRPHSFYEQEKYLRLVPTPAAAGTLHVALWRVPLEPFCASADNGEDFEIAPRYHERMLDWAIRCAYLKRDAETYDENKAAQHDALFTTEFGARRTANVQRKQRLHRPPIVRPQW
jgi:hypothetical protein